VTRRRTPWRPSHLQRRLPYEQGIGGDWTGQCHSGMKQGVRIHLSVPMCVVWFRVRAHPLRCRRPGGCRRGAALSPSPAKRSNLLQCLRCGWNARAIDGQEKDGRSHWHCGQAASKAMGWLGQQSRRRESLRTGPHRRVQTSLGCLGIGRLPKVEWTVCRNTSVRPRRTNAPAAVVRGDHAGPGKPS
jgi:hypothetical protein